MLSKKITAVPQAVRVILKKTCLLPLPYNVYLAGGTALAIYFNHRVSVDIDLFTPESFYCGPIVSSLKEKSTSVEVIEATERDTLLALVDGVRFSLFRYPYTHIPHRNLEGW